MSKWLCRTLERALAFAGPIGVWHYAGVGGCAVVLVLAAIQFQQRRL